MFGMNGWHNGDTFHTTTRRASKSALRDLRVLAILAEGRAPLESGLFAREVRVIPLIVTDPFGERGDLPPVM
jgi:hypothetical protein